MSTSTKKIGYSEPSVLWKNLDFGVFGLLILSLMLYQLQLLVSQLASFHIREMLYAYLYIRVLFFYRITLSQLLIIILLFLAGLLLVAIHTYYVAGLAFTMRAFTRFVHLALLAPLTAFLLEKDADIKVILYLWIGVVTAGIITAIYQMLGESMPWLSQNYSAIRGDLPRYKTLLGEPNVGGMSAILLYFLASTIITKATVKYFLLFATTLLAVISISKVAYMGFILANIFILTIDYLRARKTSSRFPSLQWSMQTLIVVGWLFLLACCPLIYKYMEVGFNSFIGRQSSVPGVIQDFLSRTVFLSYGGGINFNDLAQLMFGQSFIRAGSVAVELALQNAVLPHNTYLEIYLIGGFILLGLFIVIQGSVVKMLIKQAITRFNLYGSLIGLFLLISLFMFTYPNLYEPITGTLFWFIVGVACRSLLNVTARS